MKKNVSKFYVIAAIFIISLGIFVSSYSNISTSVVRAQFDAIGASDTGEKDGGDAVADPAADPNAGAKEGGESPADPAGGTDGVGGGDTTQTTGLRVVDGYGWSSNVGWVHFKGVATNASTYGVLVDAATGVMQGYAWSSNVGWLSFNSADTASCGSVATYNKTNGTFSGYAKFIAATTAGSNAGNWTGCVKLSGNATNGTTYGVTAVEGVSQATLSSSGWGSEVVGWLKMSGPGYGVTITDTNTPPTCLAPSTLITSGANAGLCQCPAPGNQVVSPGASCPGVAPAKPALSASAGSGCSQINLSWAVVPGTDHYILYESDASAGTYTAIANNIASNITTYNRTTSISGTAYYKIQAAADAAGTILSPFSDVASAVVPTASCVVAPTSAIGTFTASPAAIAKGSACKLTWTGVTGNNSCTIYRSAISAGNNVYVVPVDGSGHTVDSNTIIDASLQATTRYWIQCRADAANAPSAFSQQQTQCVLAPKYDEF